MAGVRDTARAMARFNVSDAPTHRRFTAGYYASSLHRTRAVFARACPDMAPSIDVIVRAARKIGAAELLPTHRDMKPEHVLLAHARPRSSPHSEFSVLLTADAHHPARVAIVEPNSRDGVRTGFAPPVRAR